MKVKIFYDVISDEMKFLFYEERDGQRYIVKPVAIELEAVKKGYPTEASMSIPGLAASELMVSLAEELDGQGIKTDKDSKLEGTIEATKYHLEDMRKLLKLK